MGRANLKLDRAFKNKVQIFVKVRSRGLRKPLVAAVKKTVCIVKLCIDDYNSHSMGLG